MATSPQYRPSTIRKVLLCRVLAAIQCVSLAACGAMDGTESATSATGSPTLSSIDETSSKRRQSRLQSGGDSRTTTRTATTPTPTTTAAVTEAATPTTSSTAPSVSSPTTQTTNSATPAAAINVDASNTITIREDLGVTRTNYPIQLGRVFAKGEYTGAVQLKYNGASIPTQTDVKNRWSDGSIRFAVMSAVIPTIAALSKSTVAFEATSQTSTSAQTPTLSTFLAVNPNFDASLTATVSGVSNTVTLRQMLNQGAVAEPWKQGPISSTYIIADHSAQRRFDFGVSSLKSIRPIMHVTVWHGLGMASVRFIAENSNTEGLENVTYDLKLDIGTGSSASSVYTQAGLAHHYGARWTKNAWYGGTPQPLSIDYNSIYLSAQRVVPNYDRSARLTDAQVAAQVQRWIKAPKELLDSGFWKKYMPTPGGREEIALFPNWTVDALISGDYRLQTISDGNTELALAWPMHFREGSSTKFIDARRSSPAIGKVVSLFARPGMFYFDNNYIDNAGMIPEADRYIWGQGTSAGAHNGWAPSGAHQPAPFLLSYLNTGEYIWLEQLQFWASWGAFNPAPDTTSGFYGRGPTLTSGALVGDTRRQAWLLRNRAAAAAFSVDMTQEKAYFEYLMNDAISIAEGIRGITGSVNQGSASYQWGQTVSNPVMYGGIGTSPLRFWDTIPNEGGSNYNIIGQPDWNQPVARAQAPWQLAYMIISLAHTKDLGFPVDRLLEWTSGFITEATKSNETAWLLGSYVLPVALGSPAKAVPDFNAVLGLFTDKNYPQIYANQWLNSADGYPLMMTAAVASIQGTTNSVASWEWVQTNWVAKRTAQVSARWAIVPRPQ
jgi:hypothetical protein